MSTILYGASDDLIEIDGEAGEEFTAIEETPVEETRS